MTSSELLQAAPSIIAAIGAAYGAVISLRNKRAIQEIHVSINSRMDALLSLTAKASRAEGVQEGRINIAEPKL